MPSSWRTKALPHRRAHLYAPALLVSLALVLSACTAGRDRAEGPRASAGGATETPAPSVAPSVLPTGVEPTDPSEPGATPSPEDVFEPEADILRVAVREPTTLDPLHIQDPGSVLVARQLYEGLTRWDVDKQKVVPAAARWEAGDGGRTFTFRLRKGMTFHDGTPVTAGDFVFAFDRIAQKESASDLAYTLERVEGFLQVNQLGESDHLNGLEAPDDRTLIVRLTEPFYDLPAVMTHPGLVPLSRASVNDLDRFLAKPIGNGPFEMAEKWAPGDPVVLERFDDYYDPAALAGIRFISFPDAASSWIPFTDDALDVSEVPVDQLAAAEEQYGDAGFRGLLHTYLYGLNLADKQLRSRDKRLAINFAIDREAIARTIFKGTLQPPRGIVPEGMAGFEIDLCQELCALDRKAARKIVRKLPERRRTVTIDYTRGAPHDDVVRLVAKDLESVGFDVRVNAFSFPRYLRRLDDREQVMYRLGWLAEYPTPDVFLSDLFASSSPDNHSGLSSRRIDRLLAKAHREEDDDRRSQLYLRAEKAILRKVPVVPLGSFVSHWAVQPSVQGLRFDQMGGFDALDVSLE